MLRINRAAVVTMLTVVLAGCASNCPPSITCSGQSASGNAMEKAVPLVWEIDTGVATKQFLEQWNGQWQGRQLDTPDAETLKEMERLVYRRIELLPAGRARISKFSDPSVGGGPRLASAIYGATRQGNEVILTAPQTLPPAFFWERDLRGNGTMVLRILNRTKALLLSRSPDGVYSARSILRPAGGRK